MAKFGLIQTRGTGWLFLGLLLLLVASVWLLA